MSIKEQLAADLKVAMKSGDSLRKTAIRGVMAAVKEEEQRKREQLVKQALKKHGVSRPAKQDDPEEMAAYEKAVDEAVAAENVDENSLLTDAEQMSIVQKLIKQHQDSISDAKKAGRDDIIKEVEAELALLQAYLPAQLSREEIEQEAKAVIAEVGAGSMRDMGKVMNPLMARLQGRADGKLVSDVVRGLLSG